MLSTDNQRISEIFGRLAEIAAKTADVANNPKLTETQKQEEYDNYFSEHEELTTEVQEIFKQTR